MQSAAIGSSDGWHCRNRENSSTRSLIKKKYDCDPLNDAGRTRPSISDAQPNSPSSATSTVPSIERARELPFRNARQSNLVGLFNDDTCPSGHISRPTNVNVSQSCFRALNKLLKPNYIFQVREHKLTNAIRLGKWHERFNSKSNCFETKWYLQYKSHLIKFRMVYREMTGSVNDLYLQSSLIMLYKNEK